MPPSAPTDLPGADALRAQIWRLAADPALPEPELIQRLLDTVGPALGVSRACFNHRDADGIVCTIEWCAPGVGPSLGERFPEFVVEHLLAAPSLEVSAENFLDGVPAPLRHLAAPIVRGLARRLGLVSCLAVPFAIDGRVEGALTLDRCDEAAPGWSGPLRPVVSDVVQIITQTISRTRTERALRESEQRYRELVDLLPQIVFEADLGARVTFLNRHAMELLGYSAEDLRAGLSFAELVARGQHSLVQRRLAQVLAGEVVPGTEYTIRGRRSGLIEVVTYSSRILRDGVVVGLRGVAVDITAEKRTQAERQRLEVKMQQAQKLESLGLLAGGVAHDFNNLLVSILGNAELALLDLARFPSAVRRLERIKRAAQRASELANQMLAYSGKGDCVLARVDLNQLVEEMASLLRAAVPRPGTLQVALAPRLPPVEMDATQIRQVVMNLIINASDALEEKAGAITVTTGESEEDEAALADASGAEDLETGRFVYCEVTDTGCGMDAATTARIFDPFFTTKFTGRGLGLAAVLGIVRRHRGAIKVRSVPAQGTSVRVLLPVAAKAVASAAVVAAASPAWRGHGLVLVVDDEADVREVASDMLRVLGFEVRTAADVAQALALLREHAATVVAVLLDVTMPTMNGEEAFDHLRRAAARVPIVLASGYSEEEVVRRFAGRETAGAVQKPFALDTLARKLREACGERPGAP
jgi:PAS domain S-box-containing protein